MTQTTIPSDIINIVNNNRIVAKRVEALRKIGYRVESRPMGKGGVFQIKKINNEVRIQIGYGTGKCNDAMAVII